MSDTALHLLFMAFLIILYENPLIQTENECKCSNYVIVSTLYLDLGLYLQLIDTSMTLELLAKLIYSPTLTYQQSNFVPARITFQLLGIREKALRSRVRLKEPWYCLLP